MKAQMEGLAKVDPVMARAVQQMTEMEAKQDNLLEKVTLDLCSLLLARNMGCVYTSFIDISNKSKQTIFSSHDFFNSYTRVLVFVTYFFLLNVNPYACR